MVGRRNTVKPEDYERIGRISASQDAGNKELAAKLLCDELDKDPNDPQALYLLGYVLSTTDKHGLAYSLSKRATELHPNEAAIWHNLGKHCWDMQRYEEAEGYWRRALKINPNFVNSLDGLGLANLNKCEYGMAIEYASRALMVAPGMMDSTVNRAMAYLALKKWKEGWEGYNANVGNNKDRKVIIYGDETPWKGEKNKDVVVIGEQGIGDEISFGSCLPDLIRDSKSVTIECDKRLEGVFRRSFPTCSVYGTRYDETTRSWAEGRDFDHRVLIGELPQFYRNNDADFHGEPYLVADPHMRIQWKALLESLGDKPKIGIAWTGGRNHTGKSRRSVTLETYLPLMKAVDATWVSLQYHTPTELEAFEERHGIKVWHWPHGVQSYDYDQTLALISELDLVISVTTTVIHAAGALGKECWCLVPKKVMWRYLTEGEWFPWAKSVTMYRQKGNEWPIHLLAAKLRERYAQRHNELQQSRV